MNAGVLLLLEGSDAASCSVAGRLRVDSRRLRNDDGWFSFRGVSDLAAIGYVLSGRENEVWRRLDAYARAKRTAVRVLGMLGAPPWQSAGLAFSPKTAGYTEARQQVVDQATARGLYVKLDLFADAQIVVPDANERRAWTLEFADFCRANAGVLPGLSNEPYKNGWDKATDPALLSLAETFAQAVGHRDFSIGDAAEGADLTAELIELSQHANIVETHPDRAWGGDDRWRRWLDHLEGITEVLDRTRQGTAYLVSEPIGAALKAEPGRRDDDPDALAAGPFVSACCGYAGYVYHKIDSEIDVDLLPGFYDADALARIPCSPDWRYLNDSWPDAPTDGITWKGKTGKVRNLVSGGAAWTVAYGEADFDSVRWRPGWTPTLEYAGQRIRVWSAVKEHA